MKYKPILIVAGEPFGVFLEIFFNALKNNIFKKPLVLIVSKDLLIKQMKILNYNFKINLIDERKIKSDIINNKSINILFPDLTTPDLVPHIGVCINISFDSFVILVKYAPP